MFNRQTFRWYGARFDETRSTHCQKNVRQRGVTDPSRSERDGAEGERWTRKTDRRAVFNVRDQTQRFRNER
jgi:hypothetical protein